MSRTRTRDQVPAGSTRTRNTTGTRTERTDAPHARVIGARLALARAGAGLASAASTVAGGLRAVVTPAGWAVAAWTVGGLVLATVLGWEEAWVAAIAGAVLLATAAPFLIGSVPYRVRLLLDRDAVVAGERAEARLVVDNPQQRAALPGRVDLPVGDGLVEVEVPYLRGGAEHVEPVEVPALRRGIVSVGPAVTTRYDPLRLLERHRVWEERRTLYVHPRTVAVPSTSLGWVRDLEGDPVRTLTTEDISFHAVRPYERGDARRHIHWASTARTGTLMVRQFEETRRSLLTVVLDLDRASYADDEEVELAISAAGSLGVRALRDGRDVEAVVGGEVPGFARASLRALRHLRVTSPRALLDDLSGVEASDTTVDLPTVTRMLGETDSGTALAILVTGSRLPRAQLRAAALHLPLGASVGAVVCDPAAEPASRTLAGVPVVSLGILDDLRTLLSRGAARR
ncbi:DUF58 domain-containing protein [Demequina sp. SYSU T00039]|uniref:DUF58 domain-containing protein n=1 Tax=Demequina lignilytica TaxID=3051663 RepID=A0AAW7M959_9MICO|nr:MULTISPECIES: DUF58 domain-containing protein [unclassified Demequina]MDN4477747.1 DUF58 domain-containing protein [Demequina sp. SYSU T00039-1]MDN4487656.1 DUF58 domain-containing protein [Demequina sp. SYSU T00039]